MQKSTRKINWLASSRQENGELIQDLERALAKFYATNPDYYRDINFTANNWIDPEEKGYQEIARSINRHERICEIGCGQANVLNHYPEIAGRYSGCDFSFELMDQNKLRFPSAAFIPISEPGVFPFLKGNFDLVFSIFVLEHSTRPAKFLDECSRILKPGGELIILCPDFLKRGRMTSQRAGWSEGTASQKLKKGRVLDAFVTLFDNRLRIPSYCRSFANDASKSPLFLVNMAPVVFEDRFIPDADAVYVTFKKEMSDYLGDNFSINKNSQELKDYEKEKSIIFLSLTKKIA